MVRHRIVVVDVVVDDVIAAVGLDLPASMNNLCMP